MKIPWARWMLLGGVLWAVQSAAQTQIVFNGSLLQSAASTAASPENLLEQSYRQGHYFGSEERCFLLFRLADAAAHMHTTAGDVLAKRWAEELFRQALKLPDDWNKGAFQKNALVTLSLVDAVKAFDWFRRMPPPNLSGGTMPPEDLRSFGARTIFLRLWEVKGETAIAPIRRQARYIGQTGEYPYAAMIPILAQLAREHKTRLFESIVTEAITFHNQGVRVRSANREFLDFLNANWPNLSPVLKREVLDAAVSNLVTAQKEKADSTRIYSGRVVTNKGTVSFSNPDLQLLYKVLPKVREIDPRWAERLEQDYPELVQSGDGHKFSSEMTIVKAEGVTPERAAAEGDRRLQGSVLAKVEETASSDPDGAANLMNSITDPEFRSEGLSTLASSFGRSDPAKGKTLLDEAEKNARDTKDSAHRLAALVALAKSAASLHDHDLAAKWMDEAFNLGEEILNEDLEVHPGKAVYMAKGLDALSELTSMAVQMDFYDAMARLEHVRNERLQAYLFIAAAEGMQKSRAASHAASDPTQQ